MNLICLFVHGNLNIFHVPSQKKTHFSSNKIESKKCIFRFSDFPSLIIDKFFYLARHDP